jgi:hypothetical protein
MKRALLVPLAGAVIMAASAQAHHSFAAYYFESQAMKVEGEVVQFEYRAPHAWLHVRGRDDAGDVQTFAAEWANPSRLSRENITKDTLAPGDMVVITGSPSRDATEHRLHLKAIRRPSDGWSWSAGRGRR